MGTFYEVADYVGPVDVGMALTNIEGLAPFGLRQVGPYPVLGPCAAQGGARHRAMGPPGLEPGTNGL
jgi:hypothetical protein